jgi:hypothetical protein
MKKKYATAPKGAVKKAAGVPINISPSASKHRHFLQNSSVLDACSNSFHF